MPAPSTSLDLSLVVGLLLLGGIAGMLIGAAFLTERRRCADPMGEPFGDVPAPRPGTIRRTERAARHLRP